MFLFSCRLESWRWQLLLFNCSLKIRPFNSSRIAQYFMFLSACRLEIWRGQLLLFNFRFSKQPQEVVVKTKRTSLNNGAIFAWHMAINVPREGREDSSRDLLLARHVLEIPVVLTCTDVGLVSVDSDRWHCLCLSVQTATKYGSHYRLYQNPSLGLHNPIIGAIWKLIQFEI